jgi:SPP1 gp7 family putative phage head morphogenesis protein
MPSPINRLELDAIGRSLRSAVLLRRYENELASRARGILAAARDKLVALLLNQDPTDVSAGRVPRRLQSLQRQADDILTSAYRDLNEATRESLVDLAAVRAQGAGAELAKAINQVLVDATAEVQLPSRALLRAIVTEQPVRGAVMYDWWKQQRLATRLRFQTEVRIGITNGESIDDLVRRVRGRAAGGGRYEGGVLDVSTRQAEALVRTSVTQIATRAAFDTYAANDDLTQMYEYVAVLDDRTTEICANLDGEQWRYDDPSGLRPPQHWNCRSTIVPVIDYKGLGLKPPVEEDRQLYPEWFADQSVSVQDAILGPSRAALVRDGKATLADMVRRDGSRVPLSELEAAG